MAEYKCKHCGITVERTSDKQWIKSICEATGKDVHLIRVKKQKLRKDE